jgi:hypothetical protein
MHGCFSYSSSWSESTEIPKDSSPASLAATAAIGALVLFYVLRLGWSDLDALAMEPFLTQVAADPEIILSIVFTACATLSFLFSLSIPVALFVVSWKGYLGAPWVGF